ncbi:MAG: hypothetical protein ABI699_11605 [Caldimonas sp.]
MTTIIFRNTMTAVVAAFDVTVVINNAGIAQFGGLLAEDAEARLRRQLETG